MAQSSSLGKRIVAVALAALLCTCWIGCGPSKQEQKAKNEAVKSKMNDVMALLLSYQTVYGSYPDQLADIKKLENESKIRLGKKYDFKTILVNPRTNEDPGFGYAKAEKELDASHLMLWELEGGKKRQGGIVAYGDGHLARE